jgi:ankyrin repeat protein
MSWIPPLSAPIADRQPHVVPTVASLLVATQRRDAIQVQALLARGADPNGGNAQALCVAAHDGSLAIVRLLVDAGAHVNTRRGLPLILAVDAGHFAVVQLLLARGADPNESSGEPVKLARHTRRDDILRALLESGATAVLGEPATRSSSELVTSLPTAHATEVSEDKEN